MPMLLKTRQTFTLQKIETMMFAVIKIKSQTKSWSTTDKIWLFYAELQMENHKPGSAC